MENFSNKLKSLSALAIEESQKINRWLDQFTSNDRNTAKTMLRHLKFVSRDTFSSWIQDKLESLPKDRMYALYAVRKINENESLWNDEKQVISRIGETLGSEDLVYSVISNIVRNSKDKFLDHPTLDDLKKNQIHHYVLIDDSIGSGNRITKFIKAMLSHRTFLSWWSMGIIKFHIVSFYRYLDAERRIISEIAGSDHFRRKYRKSSKFEFISNIVLKKNSYIYRWGENFDKIIELCKKIKKIDRKFRLGYGETMSNIIFYHSVPNNIPGILFSRDKKWKPLFNGRATPVWMCRLLENPIQNKKNKIPYAITELLFLIKKGLRDINSISLRLCKDKESIKDIINNAITLNLITHQKILTKSGKDHLIKMHKTKPLAKWKKMLYIPGSWCTRQ